MVDMRGGTSVYKGGGVWGWYGLEWCVGELSCWRRVLKRSMVCGVNVISIRGRIGWEICGCLDDWVVVGRSGEDEVSIGGGCVAWVSGGGVGCGGSRQGVLD